MPAVTQGIFLAICLALDSVTASHPVTGADGGSNVDETYPDSSNAFFLYRYELSTSITGTLSVMACLILHNNHPKI